MLTIEQLKLIFPRMQRNPKDCATLFPYLISAMEEAQINTALRIAAFLAQLGHESGEFKYMQELASGEAYEGRKDLGNIQPGDGKRFKGRGPIQVTGRSNYAEAGKKLGLDLISNPEQAATNAVGFRIAAWFWNKHKLNELADARKFDAITKKINGGLNGKPDRDAKYKSALEALGIC